ncbi:MAG: translesion error-prone DNA polymerase V autoproteolytic subunit [Candidatus Roizmanbacteria bacterium]
MKPLRYIPNTVKIPLLGSRVKAGFPSPADDFIEKHLSLDELLIHHPIATFFIEASGTSMIGAGIHPGDILIVDKSRHAVDKDIVIAIIDNELTIKRLVWTPPAMPELHAENPSFPPIKLSNEQELTIWGVVTSVIHRYKK